MERGSTDMVFSPFGPVPMEYCCYGNNIRRFLPISEENEVMEDGRVRLKEAIVQTDITVYDHKWLVSL
jgi:hypothetical protein